MPIPIAGREGRWMAGDADHKKQSGLAERVPHFHGHRERLRERFLNGGSDALADYELIELVLFRALPRRDVKPLAKDLIARFGSFAEVVSAPRERLAEIKGLGDAAITEQVYRAWDKAIAKKDISAVVNLYAPDAEIECPLIFEFTASETGVLRGRHAFHAFYEEVARRQSNVIRPKHHDEYLTKRAPHHLGISTRYAARRAKRICRVLGLQRGIPNPMPSGILGMVADR